MVGDVFGAKHFVVLNLQLHGRLSLRTRGR
jgi:hypothetical protein